jgi:hypothetical protein
MKIINIINNGEQDLKNRQLKAAREYGLRSWIQQEEWPTSEREIAITLHVLIAILR